MRRTPVVPPRPRRRGALSGRTLRSGLAASLAVGLLGLAAPTGALAAGGTPGPEWGADQARPVGPPGQLPAGSDPTGQVGPSRGTTSLSPLSSSRTATATASGTASTPGWVLHGAGWGHGIGMSQYGAWEMAKDGYSAAKILNHYYTGTSYDAVMDNVPLRVNIAASTGSATFTSTSLNAGGAFRVSVAGSSAVMNGKAGGIVTFSRSGASVSVSCGSCTPVTSLPVTSKATLAWDSLANDRTLMKLGSSYYRDGTIDVTPASSGVNVVNTVSLHDEYLDYIMESPWSWKTTTGSLAALQAQAAAARGYALVKFRAGVRTSCNCHVYNTIRDQVYAGYPTDSAGLPCKPGDTRTNEVCYYWPNWKNAVRAAPVTTPPSGYVARYQGSIIQAFFSSSSGGRTENNEDVWGGTPLPYLRGVSDPWSLRASNPNRAWTQTTSGPSMAAVFGLPDVQRLDLRDRTVNGGVRYATATSSNGTTRTIRGDSLRAITASPGGAVKSTMIRHLTGRLAGSDRYASATAVASRVPVSASSVVIAGGDTTLSDASVSGPLAATLGAPLLLTQQGTLPAATVAELNRRGSAVKTAYIVGGTGVVSSAVESQLRGRGLAVTRLGGRDRYETSALVAKAIRAKRSTPTVVVAGGDGLVDALGASGPASALKEPILLTQASTLTPSTSAALTAIGATQSRIVGGTAVVSSTVQSQLAAMGVKPIRLAGADRYGSSAAVASFYRPYMPTRSEVVLTSGADASLVDSLVAGTLQRLIVLTAKYSLVEAAAQTLQTTPALETVTAVGGTGSIAASALTAAANS